jgi:large subunit ribosomal protein L23
MSIFSRKSKKDEKQSAKADKVEIDKKNEEKVGVIANREQKDNKEKKYGHLLAHQILVKPLLSEKTAFLGGENKYVFEVAKKANKKEVAKAIEHLYNIKPVKINMIRVQGKEIRTGRQRGKMKDWKKAVVTLKSGDKISIYEGV